MAGAAPPVRNEASHGPPARCGLPYRPYATREQFRAAYPGAGYFYEKKLQYDPQEVFVNNFYKTYVQPDGVYR